MLGVLSFLQNMVGRRPLIFFTALTVLGVLTYEGLANVKAYYDVYIQMQLAEVAARKAHAEADKARADADKTAADAKTAEAVQANADLRQREEVLKVREERLKIAEERRTATAVADVSAERQAAETAKAKADAVVAGANAVIQSRIAAAVAGSGGDNGKVVRDLEGALGDPFDFGTKPAKSTAEVYSDAMDGMSFLQRTDKNFWRVDNWEDCKAKCIRDSYCGGATFIRTNKTCWLYDPKLSRSRQPHMDSRAISIVTH